jgi:hypothetical protein
MLGLFGRTTCRFWCSRGRVWTYSERRDNHGYVAVHRKCTSSLLEEGVHVVYSVAGYGHGWRVVSRVRSGDGAADCCWAAGAWYVTFTIFLNWSGLWQCWGNEVVVSRIIPRGCVSGELLTTRFSSSCAWFLSTAQCFSACMAFLHTHPRWR